jgi:hypothetical protein
MFNIGPHLREQPERCPAPARAAEADLSGAALLVAESGGGGTGELAGLKRAEL